MSAKGFLRNALWCALCCGALSLCGAELPPLDTRRIAADEAAGIRFSADKRTLLTVVPTARPVEYVVPDGVTAIGEYAFARCPNLVAVKLPPGVRRIGNCAFYECPNLVRVNIPEGIAAVGSWTFEGCGELKIIYADEE